MKMLRILALTMAVLMLVLAFASCKKKEEPVETPAPTEPATFSNIANPAESMLENVVTAMTEITELEGFSIENYNKEFVLFYKYDEADDEGKTAVTYKVLSARTSKVVSTVSDADVYNRVTENGTYDISVSLNSATPTFVITTTKVEKNTDANAKEGDTIEIVTRTMYDATGAVIETKVNNSLNTARMFYDWVVVDRTIYSVEAATGKLTAVNTIPRNVRLFKDADIKELNHEGSYCPEHGYGECDLDCEYRYEVKATFDGNRFYVDNDEGFTVYDASFNFVAEWYAPVNTEDYKFFSLNDGNVLVQYATLLSPDAFEYDIYEGYSVYNTAKFDLVTEIFSVNDKTSKTIECDKYIKSLKSNATVKFEKSLGNNKDEATLVGDFENYAIVYSIENKILEENMNKMDIVLVGNDGGIIKTIKLAENQIGIPEKYTDTLYKVPTTYGFAITEANGTLVKQVTDRNSVARVGNYLVDDEGICDLNYNSIYDFDEKNADWVGTLDNTIFVKQYTNADKKGSYTVYAYSAEGEPKAICTYDATNAASKEFVICASLNVYAIYEPDTTTDAKDDYIYTYYNADGKELLPNFKFYIYARTGAIASYTEKVEKTDEYGNPDYEYVTKYVAIVGNFN